MRTEFENVSRKLVFISDCHGTLVSPFNPAWFKTLIRAREEGHMVLIASSRSNLASVTTLMLKNEGKPEDFFNVTVDGDDYAVIPKKLLSGILDKMEIEKADFVCEDETPYTYLRPDQVGCHLNPDDFRPNAVPSGDFIRLRMALSHS